MTFSRLFESIRNLFEAKDYKKLYEESIELYARLSDKSLQKYQELNRQFEYLKAHSDISKLKPASGNLRKEQLELLDFCNEFFDEIKELNIKPFLAYGNLIGAVRHQGFIPWDDDLDFGLMRDDYEKLIAYCKNHYQVVYYNKKLSEFNEVKDFEKMNDYVSRYPNQWVLEIWLDQLQLSRGTSVKDLKFIDFWAFDFFDDSYSLEEYEKEVKFINQKKREIDFVEQSVNFIRERVKNNPHIVKDSKRIFFGFDNMGSYGRQNYNKKDMMPRDVVLPLKKVKFENTEFYAPNRPEEFLSYSYQDIYAYPSDLGFEHHNYYKEEFIKSLEENNPNNSLREETNKVAKSNPCKVVVWGIGEDYLSIADELKFEVIKQNIEIVAFCCRKNESSPDYFEDAPLVSKEQLYDLDFDYIIIANKGSFKEIEKEAYEVIKLKNNSAKILNYSLLDIVGFDFSFLLNFG